jgi:hypothetical protein
MSAVTDSHNVIELAPFRAARLLRQPAKPYLLWYPGVGFVVPSNSRQSGIAQRQMQGPQLA